jgi:hypothetical protein
MKSAAIRQMAQHSRLPPIGVDKVRHGGERRSPERGEIQGR